MRKSSSRHERRNSVRRLPKPNEAATESATSSDPRQTAIIIASLIALTLLAFMPVLHCDFINYDDGPIIKDNPHVRSGLSIANLRWAGTTFSLGYPQPVTLVSYMIDAQLYGIDHSGGFHATNLLIHAVNVALLFALLQSATGSTWRSALVAAVFAVHPLQVESVAWIGERKGLLATFFALLAMGAYMRHARGIGPVRNRRLTLYVLILLFLTLSLLSKPIFVVFPILAILADFWPLRRVGVTKNLPLAASRIESRPSRADAPRVSEGRRLSIREAASGRTWKDPPANETLAHYSFRNLLLEKIPMFLIVAVIAYVGAAGQRQIGSTVGASGLALTNRIAGAAIVYARILWKMFDCTALAVPYPEPQTWPARQAVAAFIVLGAITVIVLWRLRSAPFLIIAWLAFLALVAPVTGIIAFGGHRFADRYSYVPIIAIAIMLTWSIPRRFILSRAMRNGMIAGASLLLGLCATLTFVQARYWRNSFTLFTHTLKVTGDNAMANTLLGNACLWRDEPGDVQRALDYFNTAIRIDPNDQWARKDAGVALIKLGRIDDAIVQLTQAADSNRASPIGLSATLFLGNALEKKNQLDEAITKYSQVAEAPGDHAEAHMFLGRALGKSGRKSEALAELLEAIGEDGTLAEAQEYLGNVLMMPPDPDPAKALFAFENAARLKPGLAEAWYGLGNANAAMQRWDKAIEAYSQVLNLNSGGQLARRAGQMIARAQSARISSQSQSPH